MSAVGLPDLREFQLSVDGSPMTIGRAEEPPRAPGAGAGDPAELEGLIRRAIDPLQLMQRVADQALAMIGPADGVLVGLVIDPNSLRYVCGAGYLHHFVGEPLALEGSLSGEAIRTGRTLLSGDTETDSRVNRHATRAFNVRSSVCVPLGGDGQPVGILNVSSATPNAFDEHDVQLLSGLADFISSVIGAAAEFMAITARLCNVRRPALEGVSPAERAEDAEAAGRFVVNVLDPAAARKLDDRSRIEAILAQSEYRLVFQPIFDLEEGTAVAAEALARFGGEGAPPPDAWLARAHRVGLGIELELALIETALLQLPGLPEGIILTLNAGPEALSSPRLRFALAAADPARIVIELTEHAAVDDYPQLSESLAGLRASGVRLAIDDAGAGFASLMHILKLAPDFIKLDRELVSGIDFDPVRRSLAHSLMRFAEDTGAELIAEGIETATELEVLRELGISRAQGFYLARPAPLGELRRRISRAGERLGSGTAPKPGSTERTAGGRTAVGR